MSSPLCISGRMLERNTHENMHEMIFTQSGVQCPEERKNNSSQIVQQTLG